MATKSSDNRLVEKGDGEQAPSVGAGAEQGAYKKLFQDSSDRSAVDKSALPLAGESPSLTSFELAADDQVVESVIVDIPCVADFSPQ